MFLRKSVGIATLIIVLNDVCSEERKIPIQFAIWGAMLVQKGNISRCIYLHQVLYIYVKIRFQFQDLHTNQDLRTRIKIR